MGCRKRQHHRSRGNGREPRKSKDVAPALKEAKEFLIDLIGCDGTLQTEIQKEAKDAGLSWATVRRAKDELKIKSVRDGYGGPWRWKRE